MKLIKPSKLDLYSFFLSMPFITLAMNLIMFEDRVWNDSKVLVISFPLLYILGFIGFYSHVQYDFWIEKKYPSINQSRRRIIARALILFFVMTPTLAVIFITYDFFNVLGYQLQPHHFLWGMLVGASINMVFETLNEADFMFQQYKESKAEKESMKQLSISQEFDMLKNQVNPHFLFNCFNTLSSLISIDKNQAEKFLHDMSKVYRYLLRNNEEGLSTVENEVKFIQSYFQLLQRRHGGAVQLNLQVDKRYEAYLLPSLTLQLLVENVVKHNALSKNKPLVIDIFTAAGNKLVISNNLQRRTVKAPSNGVGLTNIQTKYKLLKQEGFQVMEDANNFTVVLPLMWKGAVM